MKKFFTRLVAKAMRFWLFTFKNKTLIEKEIGGFRFRFRRFWLDIESVSDKYWALRLRADTHPYLYLYSAVKQEKENQLNGYGLYVYLTSMFLTKDQLFADDVNKALQAYEKRLEAEAKAVAKKATDYDEQQNAEFMKDALKRGQMTRQQRRKAEREARKQMKKDLKEV